MSDSQTRNVAVIGLGQMGGGIARNLDKAGLLGAAWDVDETLRAPFANRPGVAVVPPPEMPETSCTRFVFVVPSTKEIDQCLHEQGMLERIAADSIILDFTTSDPTESGKLAAQAEARSIAYLDCGMTGGAMGADAGDLKLMIGGDGEAISRCQDLFEPITVQTFHMGPQGAGHMTKLIHNMVLHTMFMANVEGVRAAQRAGINPTKLIEVFNAGNARSYTSEVRFPKSILSDTWDARSRVANLEKDVRMAVKVSHDLGAPTPFADVTVDFLARALNAGMKDTDYSRLFQVFDELAEAK